MTARVLNVWWDGRIVGQFTQDRHGDIGFAYAEAWLDDESTLPLSASLPKRPARFSRRDADHFLAACCPKRASAWLQRKHWASHLQMISRCSVAWAAMLRLKVLLADAQSKVPVVRISVRLPKVIHPH
ncbi:HipA N-terminal domain-containing protein [Ensifer sp. B1-9]|uniref:HipA N-terminal domain-containing protein n=1 Tax=Ensifer sp. B1-9 TaxID=3141455 RepID=UPI003D21C59B